MDISDVLGMVLGPGFTAMQNRGRMAERQSEIHQMNQALMQAELEKRQFGLGQQQRQAALGQQTVGETFGQTPAYGLPQGAQGPVPFMLEQGGPVSGIPLEQLGAYLDVQDVLQLPEQQAMAARQGEAGLGLTEAQTGLAQARAAAMGQPEGPGAPPYNALFKIQGMAQEDAASDFIGQLIQRGDPWAQAVQKEMQSAATMGRNLGTEYLAQQLAMGPHADQFRGVVQGFTERAMGQYGFGAQTSPGQVPAAGQRAAALGGTEGTTAGAPVVDPSVAAFYAQHPTENLQLFQSPQFRGYFEQEMAKGETYPDIMERYIRGETTAGRGYSTAIEGKGLPSLQRDIERERMQRKKQKGRLAEGVERFARRR